MSQTPPPGGDQPEDQPYGQQPGQPSQPPAGQPVPYGQPSPYGQPNAYGGPAYVAVPEHPQATTVLILGIIGLVTCQVLGPIAWVMGNRVVREIDASNGAIGGRTAANAGRICGIIASVLLILTAVAFIGFILLFVLAAATTATSP